ncbi:MAG: IS1 family transposase [Methylococcales bacterium]|nr:IS1 family transposase [Methylococcales bacterium]
MTYSRNSKPFNIARDYTDDWGVYQRHLETDKHEIGKRNTQKIEQSHLDQAAYAQNVCFSKLELGHRYRYRFAD